MSYPITRQPGQSEVPLQNYSQSAKRIVQPGLNAPSAAGQLVMPAPGSVANCPPGLEYLAIVDKLFIHQKVQLIKAFTNFQPNTEYTILNSARQQVYSAIEDVDCCSRNCFGRYRNYELKILDNSQREVMHISRDLAYCRCCCLPPMVVTAPVGNVVGFIEQGTAMVACKPKYNIQNAQQETIMKIDGPVLTCSCCGNDVDFQILSADGKTNVGRFAKKWAGFAQEAFTDSVNFCLEFPTKSTPEERATLLGATFILDLMYYERDDRGSNNNN